MNAYLLTFAAAAALSLLLTRFCRDVALRFSWVDIPDTARKLHTSPVPVIGGVALLASTALALVVVSLLSTFAAERLYSDQNGVLTLGALCTMMMLVGLADDRWSVRPGLKFTLQVAVALAAWLAGIRIESLGTYWQSGLHVGLFSLPITVLWIVGITNAFNLLDGIDGLSAGAALFATTAMLGVAISSGETSTALILAALAGATVAFLRYNFNPASIFLGDSGSLFLGFTLSVMAVQSSQKSAAAFAVAVPIVSLGLPVLDTSVVVLRRLISGRPLFSADRRHIHHLLLDRGMTVRQVAVGMYAVCGALALVSLLVASPSARVVGPVLVILGLSVGIAVQQLQIPELLALNSHVFRGVRRQVPLLATAAVLRTMLREIENATDANQVLSAVARGAADSGLATATLSVPGWIEIRPLAFTEWRVHEARPPHVPEYTLEWTDQPASAATALTTLNCPLFDDDPHGALRISVPADERHIVALIGWLDTEVAQTIGLHLARVAGSSPSQQRE